MLLGPYALNFSGGGIAPVLADLGVVFLVFTLGLEFSLPRMIAMRREALPGRRPAGGADDGGVRQRALGARTCRRWSRS